MAKYVLRVELTNGTHQMYTVLRDGLLNIGFTKRVKDKDGVEWRLPTGNYYINSDYDKETIINAVRPIAARLDRTPMVFLCEVAEKGMIWYGLQRC